MGLTWASDHTGFIGAGTGGWLADEEFIVVGVDDRKLDGRGGTEGDEAEGRGCLAGNWSRSSGNEAC